MRPLRRAAWVGGGVLAAILAAVAFDLLSPPDLSRYRDRSVTVLAADGRLLRAFQADGGFWRFHAAPETVDPLYLRMLQAYEDKRFASHLGVDPAAVARAVWQAVSHGRVVSGASTLTMQAARVLEPRQRSVASKLAQIVRALQLERRLTKDEILSVYLTLAPFGGNLEGVRAASLAYFGREPGRLTPGQAALLVALPKSPERFRPDRFPDRARAQRNAVLARMVRAGVLSPKQADEAREEPLPSARRPLPFHAPHFARRFRGSGREQVRTTLELESQRAVETLVANWRRWISARASVAVLVRRNGSGEVAAYVGSADFFSDRRVGQVDMVRAVRSPGSTLKPFIYALAFDDGIAHPETLINDTPTHFRAYAPRNFSGKNSGEVTIREALARSLNVPAVIVLNFVGPQRFASRLLRAKIRLRLPGLDSTARLPIALGGVGVTLEELVTLYGALADRGVHRPLRYFPDAKPGREETLFRPSSAWHVARILEGIRRPGLEGGTSAGRRAIAWKTGTSYGFRDAWAIGFSRDYTVGVWVGRADGTPSPGSIGRTTAGPLMFSVFDVLPANSTTLAETTPVGVQWLDGTELPPHLRRFGPRPSVELAAAGSAPLRIVFPPDGAVIEIGDKGEPVLLEASGGAAPLRWLVDGRPLPPRRRRRDALWRPDGAGFSRITVIDAKGRSTAAQVRVQ